MKFGGYLFQQIGRLYPRDIQGVLIRLHNVSIGKYDNSMLSYPYAEGPRYSMISSEIVIEQGFEDALNIDRDSFNELHPHFVRTQAYLHALLHELIFPETWGEEKSRNRKRRERASKSAEKKFLQRYQEVTGDKFASVASSKEVEKDHSSRTSPVEFDRREKSIQVDVSHPLLEPLLRRKKHAPLVQKLVVAFERSNIETSATARRELFYQLLADVFAE